MPTELSGRDASMAIRTPNITLVNFFLQAFQRMSILNRRRDSIRLLGWIAMIEFQDDRIAFSTIHTGMG